MSYVRILVHAVFSTKNRGILIPKQEKDLICDHIRTEALKKSIRLLAVNGHLDHLHCLINLGPTQTIATVMQAVKGESAYWFNNQSGLAGLGKLIWQDDYFAVSVSESHAETLQQYIQNQEKHHQRMTYYQELERMAAKYGFDLGISDSQPPLAKAERRE